MRIGVVVNPSSRDNRRHPERAATLQAILGDRGHVLAAPTLDPLDGFLQRAFEQRIDVLGICGGDGTQHVALTRALPIWGNEPLPRILPLRGGTMNTVSSSVGVRRRAPETLLKSFLVRAARGRIRSATRTAARIGPHVGFLFGVGAVHGFLAEYYRDGDPNALTAGRTLWRAAAGALSQRFSAPERLSRRIGAAEAAARVAAPFRGSVQFREGPGWEQRDYLAITGGTIEDMGLGFRPFAQARANPGAFQLLGIHGTPPALAAALPRIWRGKPLGIRAAYDTLTSHAVITPAEPVPFGYMVDGDLYHHDGPLTIATGPSVRFVF